MGAVICVPLAASIPLQPPDAVQESALVEFHVSDEEAPRATAPGDAESVAVGKGFTVTAAFAGALFPPGPEHVITKFALPLNAPLLWLPLVARVSLQAPVALHEVAFVEVHVSATDWPASIVVSDAESETVGAGVGVTVPPPHAHSSITGTMIKREYKRRTPSQLRFSLV
jgi:hypothetical protein